MSPQPDNRRSPTEPGRWWICTRPLDQSGTKILGPFESKDLALRVRDYVEFATNPETYWIDQEATDGSHDAGFLFEAERDELRAALTDLYHARGKETMKVWDRVWRLIPQPGEVQP